MNDDIVVSVKNVSKKFLLPHEKKNSVKSLFTGLFNSKRAFSNQQALKDISFDIKKGEFFGIVGRNGSGKSTLLKIIAGIYQPTKGKVTTNGKLVPFIELGVGFNPELTGRENVFLNGALLGFTRTQINANYNKIVSFAELEDHMDVKLKNYSSGMQVRLAFACATMAKADILVIDEVLAVGDSDFQHKCFEYFKSLKKNKVTVVFVSHDMTAVKEYCDTAALIENNKIIHIGKPAEVANEYDKLFILKETTKSDEKRNGDGRVKINSVSNLVNNDSVNIKFQIKANTDIERVIYGVHIISKNGHEITASNNRMISQEDIIELKKDNTVDILWSIPNIFSTGLYDITITIVDDTYKIMDWWINASTLMVNKKEKSTTEILPNTKVTITRK